MVKQCRYSCQLVSAMIMYAGAYQGCNGAIDSGPSISYDIPERMNHPWIGQMDQFLCSCCLTSPLWRTARRRWLSQLWSSCPRCWSSSLSPDTIALNIFNQFSDPIKLTNRWSKTRPAQCIMSANIIGRHNPAWKTTRNRDILFTWMVCRGRWYVLN